MSLALLVFSSQGSILLFIDCDEELQGRLHGDVNGTLDFEVILALSISIRLHAGCGYIVKIHDESCYSIDSLAMYQFASVNK
jgi:hypothetical protein